MAPPLLLLATRPRLYLLSLVRPVVPPSSARYRVLKIPRTASSSDASFEVLASAPLLVLEDAHEYTPAEADALLLDLHVAHGGLPKEAPTLARATGRVAESGGGEGEGGASFFTPWREGSSAAAIATAMQASASGGLKLVCTADAFLGAVRFTAGDYLFLVTRARRIGAMLGHAVYGVASTLLVPVQHPGKLLVYDSAIERRYRKLFTSGVDLTKGFFYCPSASVHENLQSASQGGMRHDSDTFVWNTFFRNRLAPISPCASAAERRACRARWCVRLVHGAFEHRALSVYGRHVDVTLICRRSRHFAGTRYLKRGVSEGGHVANEVETEQLVEADVGFAPGGATRRRVASHVQVRGSIPLHWSQEASPLSPKPDILLHRNDPLYAATGRHLRRLAQRYGHPVAVLNLVKSLERRPREMVLRRELQTAIHQLNEHIGHDRNDAARTKRTLYYHFDMAAKARELGQIGLLEALTPVARTSVELTGMFGPLEGEAGHAATAPADGTAALEWQKGVVRTNCVDCLDRTNVAQFAIGLMALSRQLHAVGLLGPDDAPYAASTIQAGGVPTRAPRSLSPAPSSAAAAAASSTPLSPRGGGDEAPADVDASLPTVASVLMELYEEIGDELARQYGGSSAHSVFFQNHKGMGGTTSHGRDLLTSARRFYSNSFTDDEKQDAINLFLGTYRAPKATSAAAAAASAAGESGDGIPTPAHAQHIWDLESDAHLHGFYGPSVTAAGVARAERRRAVVEAEASEADAILGVDDDDDDVGEDGELEDRVLGVAEASSSENDAVVLVAQTFAARAETAEFEQNVGERKAVSVLCGVLAQGEDSVAEAAAAEAAPARAAPSLYAQLLGGDASGLLACASSDSDSDSDSDTCAIPPPFFPASTASRRAALPSAAVA